VEEENNVNADFVKAVAELGEEKGISPEILYSAVEEALVTAYKKNYGNNQNVRVALNKENGEIHVYARKQVVENVEDTCSQISLEDAMKINKNYQIDDVLEEEVTPRNFGRIAAQNAKQVIVQRIREAERGMVYEKYSRKENDIVSGIIQRVENHNVYLDLGSAEGIILPNEQIPTETYTHNERIRCYVVEVKKTTKGPQIILSRTHPGLLKRLFEMEVAEIQDGTVEIKSVAREAGMRSKIAVYSSNPNVDPVGACVGPKGMRVRNIVDELHGEKVDIVEYSDDPEKYVANALSPSKVIVAVANADEKICRVIVPDYQLSLAIGKEGQNARLAAKLTGWKIDIKSETQAIESGELEYDDDEQSGAKGAPEGEAAEETAPEAEATSEAAPEAETAEQPVDEKNTEPEGSEDK
jgi:N utilization substance protein A